MLNSLVGIIASSGGAAGGGAYESIASATGTGSSGTITFSSIPSTYTSLQIRGTCRTTGATQATIRFNGDTGANYASHQLYGDGTSAAAGGISGVTSISNGGILAYETSAAANLVGVFVLDVHDYASTTRNKTTRIFSGRDENTAGFLRLGSGLWTSTAAVTSVTILISSGNFTNQTTFSLYGIKGA
jgi:hypothetical protein